MCIYVYVICRKEGGSQFFTIRTDPMPVNNFFSKLSNKNKKKITEKNSRKRYCDHGQR